MRKGVPSRVISIKVSFVFSLMGWTLADGKTRRNGDKKKFCGLCRGFVEYGSDQEMVSSASIEAPVHYWRKMDWSLAGKTVALLTTVAGAEYTFIRSLTQPPPPRKPQCHHLNPLHPL